MHPRHVLIATIPNDLHATVARIALRNLGHRATLWMLGDLPETACASWALSDDTDLVVTGQQAQQALALSGADAFWFRRVGSTHIGREMHPADRAMALNETASMTRGLLQTVSASTFAVNDYAAAMAAEIKPHQLAIAKRVGLSLPTTLISNDPARIRSFIAQNARVGTIYKPFVTAIWESSDERVSFSYTAPVTEDDLPSDATLRLTPGIFQEKLDKQYELRVTCMGDEVIAVRLDSQASTAGSVDWRSVSHLALRPERVTLPAVIEQRCVRLLRELGLQFGCIDLVVKPDGEHVFLEINQMGQFLWIEEANPGIPLLDAFIRFLLRQGRPPGADHPASFGISYHEFREEAMRDVATLMAERQERTQGAFVYAE